MAAYIHEVAITRLPIFGGTRGGSSTTGSRPAAEVPVSGPKCHPCIRPSASEIISHGLHRKITIAPHLTFDALAAGEAGAPLVLLLHGFAEIDALLARASGGARGRGLSRGGAEPARLFAGRAAGRQRQLRIIISTG